MRELGQVSQKRPLAKILLIAGLALAIFLMIVKLFNLENLFFRGPTAVIRLITDSGLKSDRGRLNVLLLGIGGAGHEGPNLTDTIILASIDEDGDDVVLISIPRDLWVPSLSAKINSAYAFGQEKNGEGIKLAKKSVSGIFDLPIHYVLRVDFRGFEKAIDLTGGIDVAVETPFVDMRYPIAGQEDNLCGLTIEVVETGGVTQEVVKDATGSAIPLSAISDENDPFTCRYETISFPKGLIHMDGATSLKFVRSRHGTNDQSSDFARSARQQKIILAFRQKVLAKETLLSPKTIIDLAKTFGASIDTDITDKDIPYFAKLTTKIDSAKVRRVVLDSGREESILVEGTPTAYQGQSVLVPKNSSYRDLAEYVQGEIFSLQPR